MIVVGVGLGGLVLVNLLVDEIVGVETTFVDDRDELEPLHVPPTGLQPAPQYAEVEPHQPYCEQQFPNVEPMQVIVLLQVPSVLIALAAEVVVEAFDEVVEVFADELVETIVLDVRTEVVDGWVTVVDERVDEVDDLIEDVEDLILVEEDFVLEDSIVDELMIDER